MLLDSEEINDLLDLYKLAKKVLVDLAEEYWSSKWARMIAENIAVFYKTLIEKGIPEDFAKEITRLHVINYKLLLTIPENLKINVKGEQ